MNDMIDGTTRGNEYRSDARTLPRESWQPLPQAAKLNHIWKRNRIASIWNAHSL